MASKPLNKGNGRWFLRVCCGYEGTHKKTISRTIRLDPTMTLKAQEREASKQSSLLEAEAMQGKLVASKSITVQELSKLFMRDHVERRGLSPKTRTHYQYLLDNFILPSIGKTRIRDIKPIALNNMYSRIKKQPSRGRKGHISGTYLQKVHGLLKNMLSDAVQWGMIAVNPADRIEAPRKEMPHHSAYEPDQCIALLDALDQEPLKWRTLGVLALYSQMRRGEIVALNWSDINNDTVNVWRSAVYVPGEGVVLRKTKTNASVRQLVLSQDVLKLLREWKVEQAKDRLALGGAWIDEDAIFTRWNGGRMHVESPTKWFKRFLEKNDLPHIRFHDLRHTGASMLISKGMDVESVRQRLGHADASTTLRFYTHAFAEADKRSADILQDAFKRPKSG